ncbi:GntR family transcriptional regulator [Virgibacillus byunsanensis]|uniref:GntR family transcriptional regulator n=1 Tax=Virgibacillus byunsanensis TaxID=570945 RepID=A0ABW3LR47_9BACI
MTNQTNRAGLRGLTAKDYAYNEIKQGIIEGKLPPNLPVREEEISSKLKISRTPLRGAFERLEFEKMVVRQSNGRLKIAPISVQEVKEIFKVRSKLEEIAVFEATERASDEDIKNLYEIAESIRKTTQKGNIEEILHHGGEFHLYLYQLSGNRVVSNFLSQLNDHIHRYRRLVPKQSLNRIMEEGEEHLEIVDCIAKRDAKGAELAMKKHIENSLKSAVTAIGIYEKNKADSIW